MSVPALLEHVVVTRDAAATQALAARLAHVARAGDLLCLVGDLGAGKTQFAKGFAAGLGVEDRVVSPTFVLMAEYAGRRAAVPPRPLPARTTPPTRSPAGLLDDRQAAGVALVEWAERLGPALPAARLDVLIDGVGDEPRRIALRTGDEAYRRYLEAAA